MNKMIRLSRLAISLIIIWSCNSGNEPKNEPKEFEIVKLKPFKTVSAFNDTIFFSGIWEISAYKDFLYMLDGKNNQILCVDTNLNYKYKIGRIGKGPGELNRATDIAVSKDIVYIVDIGNRRINLYSLAGKFLNSFKIPRLSSRITIDTSNLICLCTNSDSSSFIKLDIQGNIRNKFEVNFKPWIFPLSRSFVRTTSHLLIDPLTNELYCVSKFEPVILKYSENGKLINRYDLSGLPLLKDRIFKLMNYYERIKRINKNLPMGLRGGDILFSGACLYNNLIYISYSYKVLVFDITNDKMELVKIIQQISSEGEKKRFSTICVYDDYLINESRGEIQVFKLK